MPFEAQSLKLVRTGRALPVLGLVLLVMVGSAAAALVYVPWQQSVTGRGKVTVFAPGERPQAVEAPIPGRIVKWTVTEGARVRKGQLLCVLDDLEARFLDPMQPEVLSRQMASLRERRAAVQHRLDALLRQAEALASSREAAVGSASQRIEQAGARVEMAEQALVAARQGVVTANLNADRIERLYQGGLRSARDLELARLDRVRAQADLERARAALHVARRDTLTADLDRVKTDADAAASLQSLQGAQQQAHESLAGIDVELMKLEADLRNLRRRTAQRRVYAPVDGAVVRITRAGLAETVKAGDDLCVLVPAHANPAVELYVTGTDAPLLSPGLPVRLMFDGFPAVPFTAWPWASVGTFPGVIAVVDAVDDGTGRYRLLIRPDRSPGASPWPPPSRLRPGAGAVGWIMLQNVPLYWEVWRQLNAFPPTVTVEVSPVGPGADRKSDATGDKKLKPVIKR